MRLRLSIGLLLATTGLVFGQTRVAVDSVGEAWPRLTDFGADGVIDEALHLTPDLIGYQIGRWQPVSVNEDIYQGDWSATGGFLRFDFAFLGLINPPGPLALVEDNYAPFMYGPNPFVGYIEFDVDSSAQTGGEVDFPEFRYLGNLGRFGGRATDPVWGNRMAVCRTDIDSQLTSPPLIERSGEEFHLACFGDGIEAITEINGDGDGIFEWGELWVLQTTWLHRAHVFERFSGAGGDGVYEPPVDVVFDHRLDLNWTIVTVVFPLTNLAAASARQEIEQPHNGSDADQASILEGLVDLRDSVMAIPAGDALRFEPDFDVVRDWETATPATNLNPDQWRVNLIVGMPYAIEDVSGAFFAPTDVQPEPLLGDFDGDGVVKAADLILFDTFLTDNDGAFPDDADGATDGAITIEAFGIGFCMYDLNYDGVIDDADRNLIQIMGDLDFDLDVDFNDLSIFVTLLLHPEMVPVPVPPGDLVALIDRADFDRNGLVNGRDIQGFTSRLLAE